MIDKVVRAKALQGPIGVDNSEVINLEMERELKKRNKNLPNHSSHELIDDEDQINEEDRENLKN